MRYRRIFTDGHSYFITMVTFHRKPLLIDHIEDLRLAFKLSKQRYTYDIDAIIVLTEHLHMSITPKIADQYPKIINHIKLSFVYRLKQEIKDMSETFADTVVIEKVTSSIPTAALEADKHQKELITYLHTLEVDAYHPAEKIATLKLVEALREAGFFVNVYTVNAPSRQQELFSWGVNGIFTDNLGE